MARVVSIINLKGGVGKSTLAMLLGEYLAFQFHKRVLLIDMDAQANLSYLMVPLQRIESQRTNHRTIYDFFKSAMLGQQAAFDNFVARPPLIVSNINNPWRTAEKRPTETLDMVISVPAVAQLDQELLDLWKKKQPMPQDLEHSLRKGLASVEEQYDVSINRLSSWSFLFLKYGAHSQRLFCFAYCAGATIAGRGQTSSR